ncbi:MAG: RNase adaptor protein RapZ, partial [Clostridium sp.]
CTGGRHRSVAIANKIYEILEHSGYNVNIDHRDINEDVNRGNGKL